MSEARKNEKMEVVRESMFNLQVCVDKDMSDDDVERMTNSLSPCGTTNGWQMMQEHENGDPARAQCHDHENKVHISFIC